ncbi:hypothetical protein [Cellulomonas sp. URHD0024]|uniref:hypothetical protein n=1 Tax=Cellulomonas sp. URHD0024 TaxID=1302620 RepID=UPI0012DEE10C|nr:hypothetical protein [Cellulomonas sp. URHD0024]
MTEDELVDASAVLLSDVVAIVDALSEPVALEELLPRGIAERQASSDVLAVDGWLAGRPGFYLAPAPRRLGQHQLHTLGVAVHVAHGVDEGVVRRDELLAEAAASGPGRVLKHQGPHLLRARQRRTKRHETTERVPHQQVLLR